MKKVLISLAVLVSLCMNLDAFTQSQIERC
jgi:hypothetical protein